MNKELIETTFLENTPFAIVRLDNKYFVGCGQYRLTNYMDTKDEAEEYARRITWNNITAVIAVIVHAEIEAALKIKPEPLPTITLDEMENQ